MKKLLIATTNSGKIHEYKTLLRGEPFELLTLNDIEITVPVEEDGETLEANAVKKAVHYAYFSGLPTMADDGGIEVEALGGEPGVKSRRWPGYEASDEELIEIMLNKMKEVPWEQRRARFRVCLAFAMPNEDEVWVREGAHEGYIAESAGQFVSGYPFRSLFWLPEFGKTLGELTPDEEAEAVLHRKKALTGLLPVIKEKLSH